MKPAKHLKMGIGIKTMTGQSKVVNVLNRSGYCISDTLVHEYINEMAESVAETDRVTPDGLECRPGLNPILCFDNYDEYHDSLDPEDASTNDTQGIMIQDPKPDILPFPQEEIRDEDHLDVAGSEDVPAKRRRRFVGQPAEIEPYIKNPKATLNLTAYRKVELSELDKTAEKDNLWLILLAQAHVHKQSLPMWRGWNSLTVPDPRPVQKIGYLKNIALPPTRNDVVHHTLVLSETVRQECDEPNIVTCYDLVSELIKTDANQPGSLLHIYASIWSTGCCKTCNAYSRGRISQI